MSKRDLLDETRYTTPVMLIPEGCPQFLDFKAEKTALKNIGYAFEEWKASDESDKKVILHAFRPDEQGDFIDELEPSIKYRNRGYEIESLEAIEPWLGKWMPLPFFRMRDQKWPDGKGERLEYGPTNWARGRLCVDGQNPDILRLTLVFDMEVDKKESDIYASLRKTDVDANAKFRLAWRLRDNAWFLALPWVEQWLRESWQNWKNAIKDDEPDPYAFLPTANFLVYLECLKTIAARGFSNTVDEWDVQVINPMAHPIINVDLVLDIGNSRTTGILVETAPDRVTQLKDGYLLQLRDMTQPEKIYAEPFDTRVEFCEISFGNEALNLRSGRRNPAFVWPSPVRIGPEAARLATQSRSGTGSTGMSSPKRYLWDERDWTNSWRFNTGTNDAPYVTRGPVAQRINSSGTPLKFLEDPVFAGMKPFINQEDGPAFESFFTRSSLMMFLLIEIIHQALLTINSPAQRQRRGNLKDPRRLRQIIFTTPPGMPKAEQKIYRRWATWAVQVLWESLGWQDYLEEDDGHKNAHHATDYRDSPVVRCEWDEATCTQLVYIYNEITRKFQGDAALFCELMGRSRIFNDRNRPSIRVATIDIGGGTTDLSITTYELASDASSTPRMAPHPDFHDGFNLGGDDILHNVIREQFFPALARAFSTLNISNIDSEMVRLFGPDVMDTSEETRKARTQFVRQIAVPAGLCLLELYETSSLVSRPDRVVFKLADCFENNPEEEKKNTKEESRKKEKLFSRLYPYPGQKALSYIPGRLDRPDFNVMDVEIEMNPASMTITIEDTVGHILAQLCEVIKLYDCDALLLTGRPSRWEAIVNRIVSLVPVPPGRITPMSQYVVDEWYPFRNTANRITDPKTTVVVGAILCALAEGQLEGFSFDPRSLAGLSTARYIGQMEPFTDQIKKEKVWFTVNPAMETVEPEERTIAFSGPISVGFRQLEADRWTTTRYHFLDFANEEQRKKYGGKELKVTLKLNIKGDDRRNSLFKKDDDQEITEGEFILVGLEDPDTGQKLEKSKKINEILEMRLQTLPRDEGFWMDTGVIRFK